MADHGQAARAAATGVEQMTPEVSTPTPEEVAEGLRREAKEWAPPVGEGRLSDLLTQAASQLDALLDQNSTLLMSNGILDRAHTAAESRAEALQTRVEEVEEALRPFADAWEAYIVKPVRWLDDEDFRRARDCLASLRGLEGSLRPSASRAGSPASELPQAGEIALTGPHTADRTHVPELERWAFNQRPKTNDWAETKLYRYDGTDLYQWFGRLIASVFWDAFGEPFVIGSRLLAAPPTNEADAGGQREREPKATGANPNPTPLLGKESPPTPTPIPNRRDRNEHLSAIRLYRKSAGKGPRRLHQHSGNRQRRSVHRASGRRKPRLRRI